jgi:hypothetical protein
MTKLWEKLIIVRGLKHLLPVLQKEIIVYLSRCLKSSLWSEREAACNALEAFLPLRPWAIVR